MDYVFSSVAEGSITSTQTGGTGGYLNARAGTAPAILTATTDPYGAGGVGASETENAGTVQFSNAQTFLRFDTGTTLYQQVLVSAYLRGFCASKFDGASPADTIKVRSKSWGPPITTGQRVAGASLSTYTLMASKTVASHTVGIWNNLTSAGGILTGIVTAPGPYTDILIHMANQENTSPNGNDNWIWYSDFQLIVETEGGSLGLGDIF